MAILLAAGMPAWAAIAAGPNTGAQGTGTSLVSPSITTATGDLVMVGCAAFGQAINAPTDSKSNAWTQVGTTQTSAGGSRVALFQSILTTGGTLHTFTCHPAASADQGIAVQDFTGVNSTPGDGSNGGTGSSTAPSSGSITPGTANDVIVGVVTNDDATPTVTVGSGFTLSFDAEGTTSQQPINMEYQILSGTPATAATWTLSPTGGWAAVAGMFKPSGGAAATPVTPKQKKLDQIYSVGAP